MSAARAPRRAAVLGHPVAHSLSPVLHRTAYEALGLDGWSYEAIDTTEEQLPALVNGLDASWAGLSLTMPLKHAVIPLLDHVDPLANVVGAVNTLVVQATGGRRPTFVGTNTDVHGLVAALREGLGERGARTAVVLGAGATAASTLAALAELGCTAPTVLVRSLGRTGTLQRAAHRMGVEPRFEILDSSPALVARLGQADVVVATLPSRAADPVADALAQAAPRVTGVLLDVVYDPRPTALSAAWAAAGGIVVGGERMLLHQAAEQVRLMTGKVAPLAAMDQALEAALGVAA
ncbi:shikimate dehydrogenase [Cellulosimicrobium cellulans]|uniref:shikimate dehydrogenase n=1 Tax=Cellulosimicrobium cellulans TaxID=1710 RepID=UPI002096F5D1|nr:shikimate dehydrogenase [Cellulosimicrobium cellulans]MCO7271717.1 shikimate dehydrogenase [Cellulosimicrobium cellulans]